MASVSKREWTSPKGERKFGFEVRYKEGGKHRSKTFKLKKQADEFRRKIERDAHDGTLIAESEKKTVDEVAEEFMRFTEDRMRAGIIGRGRHDNIRKAVDLNLKPRLGSRLIADITDAELEKWFHALVREDKLAPRTARERLSILHGFFKYAERNGAVKRNVAAVASQHIGKIPHVKIRTFDQEAIISLFKAVESRPKFCRDRTFITMQLFVYLAALCGLRLSEIRALRLRHVDFDRGVIEVRHSMIGAETLKGPKTAAGNRDVPMPHRVAQLIRKMTDEHFIANDHGLIFTSINGRALSSGNFRTDIWYPLLKRIGLFNDAGGQLHFHALRHFYCSMLMHNGVGPSDVAALAGHSHFDVTLQVYAHPMLHSAARAAAAERLATQLLPPPAAALPAPNRL